MHRGDTWANEFERTRTTALSTSDGWIDEFANLGVKDWADEFNDQANRTLGDETNSEWLDSYDK